MEKYRSKRAKPVVSLGLECMKITFPSPTSLPFRLCFSHTVSISSLSPSPLPSLPPSARLLLTNTQLISVWRLVVLPAHWSLLPKTERT